MSYKNYLKDVAKEHSVEVGSKDSIEDILEKLGEEVEVLSKEDFSKTQEPKKKESQFKNFKLLEKEFEKGKLFDQQGERKRKALLAKLIRHHKASELLEEETQLMIKILRYERKKGLLSMPDGYVLNNIEVEDAVDNCIVKTDDAPKIHFLKKNLECRYRRDLENNKYIIFVPRNIPPNFQYSKELAQKIVEKRPVDESEYPKKKTLIHRISITPREFDFWFDVMDDEIVDEQIKEEEIFEL